MRRAVPVLALATALAGCGLNMEDQPRYEQYEPAGLFRNGRVLQAPAPGTVARGDLVRAAETTTKPTLTAELLEHGRERFNVFCSPCHSRTGDGNGMIVQRGMPRPPSFHIDRLRREADQHFFNVITNGYGVMYSYASRVPPRDRWAIVAYIRALQLSQNARIEDVPEAERGRLMAETPK